MTESKLREALTDAELLKLVNEVLGDQRKGIFGGSSYNLTEQKLARALKSRLQPTSDEGTPTETPLLRDEIERQHQGKTTPELHTAYYILTGNLERTLHTKERELADSIKQRDAWQKLAKQNIGNLEKALSELATLQSVSAAPQEGKSEAYSASHPYFPGDWLEDKSTPPPATSRGDGGEANELIRSALAIFEQAYPRPVPQTTEHNNPVYEWVGKAREYIAAEAPAPGEILILDKMARPLVGRANATTPTTRVPDYVIKRVQRRILRAMANAKHLPDAKVTLFVSDVEHLLACAAPHGRKQ